jgi:hypothetical protein
MACWIRIPNGQLQLDDWQAREHVNATFESKNRLDGACRANGSGQPYRGPQMPSLLHLQVLDGQWALATGGIDGPDPRSGRLASAVPGTAQVESEFIAAEADRSASDVGRQPA